MRGRSPSRHAENRINRGRFPWTVHQKEGLLISIEAFDSPFQQTFENQTVRFEGARANLTEFFDVHPLEIEASKLRKRKQALFGVISFQALLQVQLLLGATDLVRQRVSQAENLHAPKSIPFELTHALKLQPNERKKMNKFDNYYSHYSSSDCIYVYISSRQYQESERERETLGLFLTQRKEASIVISDINSFLSSPSFPRYPPKLETFSKPLEFFA